MTSATLQVDRCSISRQSWPAGYAAGTDKCWCKRLREQKTANTLQQPRTLDCLHYGNLATGVVGSDAHVCVCVV